MLRTQRVLRFAAEVHKLGINPCVDVPKRIIGELREASGKTTGPIPVRARPAAKPFRTTIVRYAGGWRLYLNTATRDATGVDVGDRVALSLEYDPAPRVVPMPPRFAAALAKDKRAKAAFESLTPSHRKDILNYLGSLRTEAALERTIKKAIAESITVSTARVRRSRRGSSSP